jgi:HK97 family phage major capsid protein
MAIPIVRSGVGTDLLPRDVADFIFERVEQQSAVQSLVPREPLTGSGKAIPVMTGTPVAGWVTEAGRKPVSDATLTTKNMDAKKLAVIVPFSKEYLRDSKINLMNMLRPKIAESFALAFDAACLHGTSTPFAAYVSQTTNSVELGTASAATGGFWKDLVTGIGLVQGEGQGYRHTGFAFDLDAEATLLGGVDSQGRPLLVPDTMAGAVVGRVAGRPVAYYDTIGGGASIKGFGGDWRQARYGVASDIAYDISTEASIVLADGTTQLHLWQNNLVALLAEAEYGFVINSVEAFVKYADAA